MSIVDKIVALDEALDDAGIPHAFGGALALAYCTERARGTVDIDLNVFVDVSRINELVEALPDDVEIDERSRAQLGRDGQTRAWWDTTPVDLFLSTTPFHEAAAGRSRQRELGGRSMPFLDCSDLSVFKAFFDRPRDWVDLEEMCDSGTLDADRVVGILVRYLGADDHRVVRLVDLTAAS